MKNTFWVIETARTTYWNGENIEQKAFFTSQIGDAIKFADFQSAEKIRCWLLQPPDTPDTLRSVEHSFIAA